MLPVIVFVLALWLSITWILSLLNAVITKKGQNNLDTVILIIICILWGWLYWLSH